MITRIAHVCLNVNNLDASLRFYEDALKLKRRFNFVKGEKRIGAYVQVSDLGFIEMFERPGVAVANTGIVHLCLETEDIDALMAWLEQCGVSHTEKKMGADNSWQTWVADPDGNRIEIHQYTEESSQLTGADVEVNW